MCRFSVALLLLGCSISASGGCNGFLMSHLSLACSSVTATPSVDSGYPFPSWCSCSLPVNSCDIHSSTLVDIEHLTCCWRQMMIVIVNSSEILTLSIYDFYQFTLNFDENCTETQQNSVLCHGRTLIHTTSAINSNDSRLKNARWISD